MPPSSPPLAFASFVLAAAISACSPSPKPAESPEGTASKEESDTPASSTPPAEAPPPTADHGAPTTERSGAGEKGPDVDKSMSIDTYEMTPSDCDALGRQYGEVARADQMGALSPKLSEKQRSATGAQVDKVVSRLQDTWINGCQTNLVNKAVDHDAIKCALAAKTVKAFDLCLNGTAGPAQGAGKKTKK